MSDYVGISIAYVEAGEKDRESGISYIATVIVTNGDASRGVCTVPVLGSLSEARREKISQALANVVALVFEGDESGEAPEARPFDNKSAS